MFRVQGGLPPIKFQRLVVSGGTPLNTDYSIAEWHPCIVQWAHRDGDVQESGTWDIQRMYFYRTSTSVNWILVADFVTHNNQDEVSVLAMFNHRSMSNQVPGSDECMLVSVNAASWLPLIILTKKPNCNVSNQLFSPQSLFFFGVRPQVFVFDSV